MKILLVQDADWLQKGPHPQHHLMELLSNQGHDIIVMGYNQLWHKQNTGFISHHKELKQITRFYPGKGVDYYQPAFLQLPIFHYLSYFVTSRFEISKIIDTFRPDIIISVTSIISSYWGLTLANKYHIPFIYYWTDVIHELIPQKILRPIGRQLEKYIIQKSSMIIYTNDNLGHVITALSPSNSNKLFMLKSGVDLSHFSPKIKPSDKYNNHYIKSSKDIVFLYMGWIYPDSGLNEVILSLKDLSQSDIKLIVVGDGDGIASLKKLVSNLSLESQVYFFGWCQYSELPSILALAEYYILPAPSTRLMNNIVPVKIYEYLGMGRPVITTALPGIMKEFGHRSGVIYVKNADDILVTGIRMSTEEYINAQENALNFIEKYSWNDKCHEFIGILNSLLEVK